MSINISFFDFKNLNVHQQHEIAEMYGMIINKRESHDLVFITYEFNNFSVEITYAVKDHRFAALSAFQHKFEKALFI
jgi:hypothetical protein